MNYTRDAVLLDVVDVTKRFGEHEVLSGITVQLRDLHCSDAGRTVGQVVAFLGPSGCGKTTLLHILAGLEPPTSGKILVNGEHEPVKSGMVGMVFQKYALWNHRRVLGNLMLAGELAGMERAGAKDRAMEYLEAFDMAGDAQKFPAELSGGMQQRIAIARALMNQDGPKGHPSRLLLMDEPFSALDLDNTHVTCRMLRSVADLHDQNSIIIVTHSIEAALAVADMVWIMHRDPKTGGGRIVREIDTADIGLAWHEEIFGMPEFQALQQDIARTYRES